MTQAQTPTNGHRPTDQKTDHANRWSRYQEFINLKKLPFLTSEQSDRFKVLKELRVRDDRIAFNE